MEAEMQFIRSLLVSLAALTLMCAGLPAMAQQGRERIIEDGRSDYLDHCAACHGESGKGDGRMARILVIRPTDLTQIAKQHDGNFPFWRIYDVVAGLVEIPGHETFHMPHFWEKFSGDIGKPGYASPDQRVLQITHYLESVQER
jgi:hypothetical protein